MRSTTRLTSRMPGRSGRGVARPCAATAVRRAAARLSLSRLRRGGIGASCRTPPTGLGPPDRRNVLAIATPEDPEDRQDRTRDLARHRRPLLSGRTVENPREELPALGRSDLPEGPA